MIIIKVLLVAYLVVAGVLLMTMYLLRLCYQVRSIGSSQSVGLAFINVAVLWPFLMVVLLWVYLVDFCELSGGKPR